MKECKENINWEFPNFFSFLWNIVRRNEPMSDAKLILSKENKQKMEGYSMSKKLNKYKISLEC